MLIKELKEIIEKLPDDMEVLYSDPNFSGPYYLKPDKSSFNIIDKMFLIDFPFEEPVDQEHK